MRTGTEVAPLGIVERMVNEVPTDLRDLKDKLYEILLTTSDGDNGKTTLDQKLGVSITKAAQKEGNVQIIQLQNANVHHITEKVIDALRIVDAFHLENPMTVTVQPTSIITDPEEEVLPESEEPVALSPEEEEARVERDFMNLLFDRGLNWKDMQKYVMASYMGHVLTSLDGNRKDASKFLSIQRTYLSKKVGEFNILEETDDNDNYRTGERLRDGDFVSEANSKSDK